MALRIPTGSGRPRSALSGLLGSLLFVAIGVAMILGGSGGDGGIVGVVFFSVCAGFFAWQLRPDLLETERRSAETLLSLYPGPAVLRGSARKYLFASAGLAAFGLVGLQTLLTEQAPLLMQVMVWPGVVLSLCAAPMFILVAVRGVSLQLTGEGFVMRDAWQSRRFSWADAVGFTAFTFLNSLNSSNRIVVFDDTTSGTTRIARLNRKLTGRNTALPETFGLDPDDFAALLTAWRDRAVRARVESGSTPPERP